jgi:hypothetical protein
MYAHDSTIRYGRSAAVILKVDPLPILVDPDATIQAGAEVRISRRNSGQIEVEFGRKGFAITTDDKETFMDWLSGAFARSSDTTRIVIAPINVKTSESGVIFH